MTTHSYDTGTMIGEYARAGTGIALVGLPLLLADTAPVVTALLAAAALLFVCYGLRTVSRHLCRFEVTADGISAYGPRDTEIPWRELRTLRLCYYSTRRDRSEGWLQLVLGGRRRRLRIDSRVGGFDILTEQAVAAALSNRVRLDPATLFNIQALGLDPSGAEARNRLG